MGGTLLQKQGDKWVVIGYHSKRLPKSAKNFGITELELTGLLVMLCCSNVVQVPLSLNPFQLNLEFGTTHQVQMCYTSKQV